MPFGSLKVKLRPLRFAFLVQPSDSEALREAIETSSFLWGGSFNPIVPLFERLPRRWEQNKTEGVNARTVAAGYLDAFDPDIIVKVGALEKHDLKFSNRETIKCSEILSGFAEYGAPAYGIGMHEMLRHFHKTELTFVRHEALRIHLPKFGEKHSLFLASVFGSIPKALEKYSDKWWPHFPGLELKDCNISNYAEFLAPNNLFLRRIGSLDISVYPSSFRRQDCLFLMDANENLDVIDYWNLRALGWSVLPICKQSTKEELLVAHATEFVERNFYPLRGNPSIFNDTTLLKSRHVALTEVENFGSALPLKPSPHPGEHKLVYQFAYPRIWDEWAREKDGAQPCRIEVEEKDHEIGANATDIRFRSLVPEFAARYAGGSEARCANDIELRIWNNEVLPAEIIPEGDWSVVRAAGAMGLDEWRCGKNGLVYLPRYKNWNERLEITSASEVFAAWLKQRGWEAELSNNGHIARQMLKHLGGIHGVGFFAKKKVIELFEKLATGVKGPKAPEEEESNEHINDVGEHDFGRAMAADAFKAALKSIANEDPYKFDSADTLADHYIKRKMVQLGLKLQCPECRQHSWFSIKTADYEVRCPQCLSNFRFPEQNPREINWAYRAIGPFSLPRRAYGVYSVLLTLRFFSRLLDGATTPMLSFTAKKGSLEIEADLGLFFQRSRLSPTETELIFAECKTFGRFKEKDKNRMLELGKEFPGAVLVFGTLQTTLTKAEKALIRTVANRGRKFFKSERPFNPVLILTGNELLSDKEPRETWKRLGGDYSLHQHSHGDRRDLVSLADATQQIYLGMKPWRERLRLKSKKQRHPSRQQPSNASGDEGANQTLSVSFPVAMRQVPWR
jgi:hypothetical protein